MEKFINDKGKMRELVRVVSNDSESGYITTYRDAMKEGDVEFGVEAETKVEAEPQTERSYDDSIGQKVKKPKK